MTNLKRGPGRPKGSINKTHGRQKKSAEILNKKRTIKFSDLHRGMKKEKSKEHAEVYWEPLNTPQNEEHVKEYMSLPLKVPERVALGFDKNSPNVIHKYPENRLVKNSSNESAAEKLISILSNVDESNTIEEVKNLEKTSVEDNKSKEDVNKGGRPRGSRNKSTLLMEAIGRENGPAILAKMTQLALNGDKEASKIILERVYPIRKTYVDTRFGKLLNTIEEVNEASRYITTMALDGEISLEEAEEYGKIIDRRLKVVTESVAMKDINEIIRKVEMMKNGD